MVSSIHLMTHMATACTTPTAAKHRPTMANRVLLSLIHQPSRRNPSSHRGLLRDQIWSDYLDPKKLNRKWMQMSYIALALGPWPCCFQLQSWHDLISGDILWYLVLRWIVCAIAIDNGRDFKPVCVTLLENASRLRRCLILFDNMVFNNDF